MVKMLIVFLSILLMISCTNFQTTSEEDFDLLCQEVYLIAKIGTKKACESSKIVKEKLVSFASTLEPIRGTISEEGIVDLSKFMSDVNSEAIDEDIQMALELVFIRLKRSGAIDFQTGTELLTPRSAKLVQCVLNGFIDGCNS